MRTKRDVEEQIKLYVLSESASNGGSWRYLFVPTGDRDVTVYVFETKDFRGRKIIRYFPTTHWNLDCASVTLGDGGPYIKYSSGGHASDASPQDIALVMSVVWNHISSIVGN
jgi:hypothetical protein